MYISLSMKIRNASLLGIMIAVLLGIAVPVMAEPTVQQIADSNGIALGSETGLETLSVVPGKIYNVVLIAEYAGMNDGTSGGWYVAGDPSSTHVFFVGPDSPIINVSFKVPSGVTSIGFYISPEWYPDVNWYSEQGLNSDDADHVQIYPIQGEQGYLIAFEDLIQGGDLDYNDHVFTFGPAAPEFAFFAIPLAIMGLVVGFSYMSAKKSNQ